MNRYKKSIFIFRRDLRLEDNLGLIEALKKSDEVLPVFIFDENQVDRKKNKYFSENAFQFMISSIKELEDSLNKREGKLLILRGKYEDVIESLLGNIEAVFVNKDYTPFSIKRDEKIKRVCNKNKIDFIITSDYTLSPIETIKTDAGKEYSVFTPFMRKARTFEVSKPLKNNVKRYFNIKNNKYKISIEEIDVKTNPNLMLKGGRKEALKMMKDKQIVVEYKKKRDLPFEKGTSRLSAHIKFGTVSIREVYWWCKDVKGYSDQYISELYWRDFYLYISYHYPYVFGKSFQDRGDRIKWRNNQKEFKAWCEGKTGVPFVDAGMRQLNKIGWMHNRVRMIVASYLTKNLLIDWRWGEKYFAQKLVDYDPSSNNGGWQWSASLGADPKPIRIFNPYTQVQKYDPEAMYIKKWVKDLKDVDVNLLTGGKDLDFSNYVEYPKPLVDQKESFHRAMEMYRKVR